MTARIRQSWDNSDLLREAFAFLTLHAESLAILPARSAGEGMATLGSYFSPLDKHEREPLRLKGVHALTLAQLATDLARAGMANQGMVPISSLGMEALCARVVHMARASGDLPYFHPVTAFPGFSRALARTIRELRLAGCTPEQAAATGPPGVDLGRLLERFEAELEDRKLADLARVMELALAGIDGYRLVGLPLLLMDAPLESRAHVRLFRALAERSGDVLALTTSGGETLAAILQAQVETISMSRSSSPMNRLRKYLFEASVESHPQGEGFEIFSAPGEGLEAVEIARRVLKRAGEGVPFDQMAVLLRNPDRQQVLVEEAFRRARVPAYMSRGSARPDPSGRALLALIACAVEKCSASRFAEYLSLDQVPIHPAAAIPARWVGPDDEMLARPDAELEPDPDEADEEPSRVRAPAGWEKILVDAAVIGGKDRWERRLNGLEQELELRLRDLPDEQEQLRSHLEKRLEQLRELGAFALPLIEMLDLLPRAAVWSEWIGWLSALAQAALRKPEAVQAVLAEFEPMGETGPATLEEVFNVLSERLRFLRRDPPRRRWGRVFVGSVEKARGRCFDTVFLPGLAEGLFPQRQLEDPLLLDAARRKILEGQALPLRSDRVGEERLRLRWAVAAARERMVASYSRMDVAEARPRVPSFYALELPRAVEGKLPALKEFEERTRDASPSRLNWPAPHQAAEAIDDAEYDLVMLDRAAKKKVPAHYLVEANPHLARSLRGRWRRWHSKWREEDGLITSSEEAHQALAEYRLMARPWSASSLEQFSRCPYKFALGGILGLKPREEAVPLEQLDPLTRGALFHEVQFSVLGELKSLDILPLNKTRVAWAIVVSDKILNEVAAEYKEKLAPAIPRVWHSEMEDLRTDLRGWLQQAAQNDDDWEPIHFEFGFGLEPREGRDVASTKDEAVLAEGVRLRGSIDLVERNTITKTLRVTDHKTGKPPEQVPGYVGGGRALQPVLYALAAEKLLGGRLFYATQRGGYAHMLIPASDAAKRFMARLLANIDQSIASGFLPPAPEKDTCETCDYRVVCGPYEEQRFGRNKQRKDERLEALFEIRGML
jgi:ATP-dependent helicase/nuclease subunit B